MSLQCSGRWEGQAMPTSKENVEVKLEKLEKTRMLAFLVGTLSIIGSGSLIVLNNITVELSKLESEDLTSKGIAILGIVAFLSMLEVDISSNDIQEINHTLDITTQNGGGIDFFE